MTGTPILRNFLIAVIGLVIMINSASAQSGSSEVNPGYLTTAVPFLLISTDARISAMGGTGVALLPQNGFASLNVSSMAFAEGKSGFIVSYVPWLNKLTKDRKLMSVDGFIKLNKQNVIAASLKYLSYGQFELTGLDRQTNGVLNPNEFAFNVNYAKQFGPDFSLGTSLSYISSNLYTVNGNYAQLHNGNDIAIGISGFYQKKTYLFNEPANIGIGFSLDNVGPKMNYDNESASAFYLPTNLRLGGSLVFEGKNEDQVRLALDLSKLLVPSNSTVSFSPGQITNKSSVLAGMLNSFTDAPNGLREELQEIQAAIGFEYSIKNKLALRTGYSYQNVNKGNDSYFAVGLGTKHRNFGIDIAYLVGNMTVTSFSNTLRLTLGYNFKGI